MMMMILDANVQMKLIPLIVDRSSDVGLKWNLG